VNAFRLIRTSMKTKPESPKHCRGGQFFPRLPSSNAATVFRAVCLPNWKLRKLDPIPRDLLSAFRLLPCAICGTKHDTQADHIVPLSKGGKSAPENLQPLCQVCNSIKDNNKTNEEVIAIIQARPEWFAARQSRRVALLRQRWPNRRIDERHAATIS
jgi:hypothetical protein